MIDCDAIIGIWKFQLEKIYHPAAQTFQVYTQFDALAVAITPHTRTTTMMEFLFKIRYKISVHLELRPNYERKFRNPHLEINFYDINFFPKGFFPLNLKCDKV